MIRIKKLWKISKEFSIKIAVLNVVAYILKYINLPFSLKIDHKIQLLIFKFLRINYAEKIKKYNLEKESAQSFNNINDAKIWTMWWQGEDVAPELNQRCFEEMRKYSGKHELVVITAKNYAEYIFLPKTILSKFEKGVISIQHLSDIVRIELLRKYGGLWIDSTMLITKTIPNYVFENPAYYTLKQNHDIHISPVSKARIPDSEGWTICLIGGQKNALFYRLMSDFMKDYWTYYDCAIDYYLNYYISKIIRSDVKMIKEEELRIISTNEDKGIFGAFGGDISSKYSQINSERLIKVFPNSNTWAFKLNNTIYQVVKENPEIKRLHHIFR